MITVMVPLNSNNNNNNNNSHSNNHSNNGSNSSNGGNGAGGSAGGNGGGSHNNHTTVALVNGINGSAASVSMLTSAAAAGVSGMSGTGAAQAAAQLGSSSDNTEQSLCEGSGFGVVGRRTSSMKKPTVVAGPSGGHHNQLKPEAGGIGSGSGGEQKTILLKLPAQQVIDSEQLIVSKR